MSPTLRRGALLLLAGGLGACATRAPAARPTASAATQPESKRELAERSELPLVIRETLSASMGSHPMLPPGEAR